ncbi:hypothetical protein ACFLZ6_01920, partial [Nanoarchaeota archaeon]
RGQTSVVDADGTRDLDFSENGRLSMAARWGQDRKDELYIGTIKGEVFKLGADKNETFFTASDYFESEPAPVTALNCQPDALYSGHADGRVRKWGYDGNMLDVESKDTRPVNCITGNGSDVHYSAGDTHFKFGKEGRNIPTLDAELKKIHRTEKNLILADKLGITLSPVDDPNGFIRYGPRKFIDFDVSNGVMLLTHEENPHVEVLRGDIFMQIASLDYHHPYRAKKVASFTMNDSLYAAVVWQHPTKPGMDELRIYNIQRSVETARGKAWTDTGSFVYGGHGPQGNPKTTISQFVVLD